MIRGFYYNIPKAMFYLLKGDYRVRVGRLGALRFGLLNGLERRPPMEPYSSL